MLSIWQKMPGQWLGSWYRPNYFIYIDIILVYKNIQALYIFISKFIDWFKNHF
jgi:hypothetical protein